MKKIPTVFVRDRATGYVTDEVNPECEWVLAGEGVPTRKVDGTCVMFDGTAWWARREVKPGKTPPPGWQQVDHDEVTGKRVGWEPIEQSGFVKFWREAIQIPLHYGEPLEPGTYELIGPKINGNPDGGNMHRLISHATRTLRLTAYEIGNRTSPADLVGVARRYGWEGIVWHNPDGRRAKLKVRDYPKGAADA